MSSILFDDLNDQEFNEALEELYKEDYETKATNLFSESFEDKIKAAEKSSILSDIQNIVNEAETKRSELPDSAFGVPEQRKYPLDTEKHVRSAIKLFNYVEPKYEAQLAKKIKRKMKEYNITDISVGENNRFSKYYKQTIKEEYEVKPLIFTDRYITEEEIISDTLYELSLNEAKDVEDNVKNAGKSNPLSRESVVAALEKASKIEDDKKRSSEIRKVISSTVGKLSAKIKYVFGNLKLYNNEYQYDGYIKEVFPKYLEMLNPKDLYKLKESIMEHAFTTGRGHKSLSDVIAMSQRSTDKDNYTLSLVDKVRKDLSSILHLIDRLYEKARFDGIKPYNPKAQKEESEENKVEEKNKENEEDNPIAEKPKKRKSYWDVDVSEEDEDEAENESADILTESYKIKDYTDSSEVKKAFEEINALEDDKKKSKETRKLCGKIFLEYNKQVNYVTRMNRNLDKESGEIDTNSLGWVFINIENLNYKDAQAVLQKLVELFYTDYDNAATSLPAKKRYLEKKYNNVRHMTKHEEYMLKNLDRMINCTAIIRGKLSNQISKKGSEYREDKLAKKENDKSVKESTEILTEGFKLPKDAKAELTENLDKIKAKQGVVISDSRAKTEDKTAKFDFKQKGLLPVAVLPDNNYLTYHIGKKKWCYANIVDGTIYKYSNKLAHILESTEVLEEKAKIRSDEPDDAGYYESNLKFRGARVVVCSRYSEEAEARIKSIQKAFKNVEKSYSNILESVAEEIYAEWSRDHGERVSKEDFIRSIFKSKLQNRIIAMQDSYGYVFEFNYSVNMKVGSGRLVVHIYTDSDGFVTSYKYSTESTVRKY